MAFLQSLTFFLLVWSAILAAKRNDDIAVWIYLLFLGLFLGSLCHI